MLTTCFKPLIQKTILFLQITGFCPFPFIQSTLAQKSSFQYEAQITKETLAPPVFSIEGGFYNSGFVLNLSSPEPGATILYTLDGSVPLEENLGGSTYLYKNFFPYYRGQIPGPFLTGSCNSYIYSSGIQVNNRSSEPDSMTCHSSSFHSDPFYIPETPVFKGTVVRARCIKEGFEDSRVETQVYFVCPEGRNRYKLPVINISVNEDDFFDYFNGIYTAGVEFDNWRLANPQDTTLGNRPANYYRSGDEWEYPAHLAFFSKDSLHPALNMDMGIRIHGAWTRAFPMKSLRLYARSEYGASSFNYPVFPSQSYSSYKRLILRNSGNDYHYTMFRDAVIQKIVGHMNFDTQAYQPSVLFVNGEYWGIHNIRERYDKHYIERVYNIEPEELDFMEMNSIVSEGDSIHYTETLQYITDNNLEADSNYQYVQTRIDTRNFIDFQIAHIFVADIDWPGNNLNYFRKRTSQYEPNAPYGQDGRWRWMLYDMDYGFGMYDNPCSHNTLVHASQEGSTNWQNPDWSTFLFRNLLENEHFRTDFIIRFTDMLNTAFLPDRLISEIEAMKQVLEPEMQEHMLRWERPESMNEWYQQVSVMKSFAFQRPSFQWRHLREFFNLGDSIPFQLDVSDNSHGFIRMNTVNVNSTTPGVSSVPYPWNGFYFNGIPIELEAIPYKGYAFSHWEGAYPSDDSLLVFQPNGSFCLKAHFVKIEERDIIYFWHFGTSIPNDTPLLSIEPIYWQNDSASIFYHSALEGYPFTQGHPLWRKASLERRNSPTPLNYRPEANNNLQYVASEMRGIQVKQPFKGNGGENEIVFKIPSTDYEKIQFSFAAINEDAVDELFIDYSISESDGQWTADGLSYSSYETENMFSIYKIDFSGIDTVNNNKHFKIRLRFGCNNPFADFGDRITFNNICLEGIKIETGPEPPTPIDTTFKVFPNPNAGDILNIRPASDVLLYNINGALIMNVKNASKLDIKKLRSGVYFLRNKQGECIKIVVI